MTKNRSNYVDKIEVLNEGLKVFFSNKSEDVFPNIWLRDHAKDENNWDERSNQRKTFTAKLNPNIKIKNANISNEGEYIDIIWSDTSNNIQYSSEFLYENSINYSRDKNQIKIWEAKEIKEDIFLNYKNLINDEGFKNLLTKLYSFGFAVITDCKKDMSSVEFLAKKIGYVRNSIFGGLWSFESNANMADSAYTNEELRPHTDSTYSNDAPGLQLLLCCEYDAKGGDSIMVDGLKIAETIKAKNNDLYNALTKIEVPGNYTGDGVILEAKRPIIKLDAKNQITQISFNNYDRAPFRLNPELTKIFYEAISLFDNLANSKQYQWRYILKPGDLLIFNNWRVLHGRGSFRGKRKMKGCYINKEDFDSSCKINGLI